MGIFSYLEQSLGLHTTPRLETIIKDKQANVPLSNADFEYLLDLAGRYTTLNYYRTTKKIKLNREYDDVAYDVEELLGDVLTELDALSLSSLNAESDYVVAFEMNIFGGKNDMYGIKEYVRESLMIVKRYQKTFDDTQEGINVIGTLLWLKNHYDIDYTLSATNTIDDTWGDICSLIHAYVKDEHARATRSLEYLEREASEATCLDR